MSSGNEIIISPEPFKPRVENLRTLPGNNLAGALRCAVAGNKLKYSDLPRAEIRVNGEIQPKTPEALDRVLQDGDLVCIEVKAHGDNPLRTAFQVFVQVASIVVGSMFGPWAAAAVQVAGALLTTVMFPPNRPEQLADANDSGALRDQSNSIRRRYPMPLVLGKQRIGFDVAALGYSENLGDTSWINVIFGVHYGPCLVENIKIGETLLADYPSSDYQIEYKLAPGPLNSNLYKQSKFQTNKNDELALTGEWEVDTLQVGANQGEVDITLPNGLHFTDSKGKKGNEEVAGQVQIAEVGTESWFAPTGMPTAYDKNGLALPQAYFYINAKTQDAIRRTYVFNLPDQTKQYKVRVRAYDYDNRFDETSVWDTYWTALRSTFFRKPIVDENLSCIVLRVKSSGDLNGTLPVVTGEVTPIVPIYQGGNWETEAPSSNMAACLRWALTGPAANSPLDEDEINASCATAYSLIEANNWHAAVHVTDELSQEDLMKVCGAAGRFSTYWSGEDLCFVTDWEKPIPRQIFTEKNVSGYKYRREFQDEIHAIFVEFKNVDESSGADEVWVYADGYNEETATQFETMRLPYSCTLERAYKEGRVYLAKRELKTETHEFTAAFDSVTATYGDRIKVAHHITLYGKSAGRIVNRWFNEAKTHVTGIRVDFYAEMEPGLEYSIDVRRATETTVGIQVVNTENTTKNIFFQEQIPLVDAPRKDDLVVFGETNLVTEDVEIDNFESQDGKNVRIAASPYIADLVEAAETAEIPDIQTKLKPKEPAPLPRVISTRGLVDGAEVVFDVIETPNNPVQGFVARWRYSGASWNTLPLMGSDARVVKTPAIQRPAFDLDDEENAQTLVDVEIRTLLRRGDYSGPTVVSNIVISKDVLAPTNFDAIAVVRTSSDGSSYPAIAAIADPITAGDVQYIEVEFQQVGELFFDSAGQPLVASNPAGDFRNVIPGESYVVRARSRTQDNWTSVWVYADSGTAILVPSGSNVADDVAPITPGNVAGTPTISITSTIASDGTQTSRLFGSWGAASDALSYVIELDNGTIVQQFSVTENAIEDRIIATGPTYRYRVKALSRTGTLSAAWSSWSNNATAAGKTTSPNPIVSGSVFPTGNRQIRVNLKVPTDPDYSHALIYRNTTGISPDDIPQNPIGEVYGEFYLDAAVTIGLNYRYYARAVDRTGNESDIARFLGNAIAVYEDDRTRLRQVVGGSGSARWIRVARVQSSAGRGAARITLTTDGGAFVPSATVLDVVADWGTLGTIAILSSSISAPFIQVRLTKGTDEAYLDVQIVPNSTAEIGIEVTPFPNSGGTWATLYADSPAAGAQAICSGLLRDDVGNRLVGVISGIGGTSNSTLSSTGGGVQVNGVVGLRNTGDARLAENFINQSRFATATSLSLADADIAAPWSALDYRPTLTQGNSLTEDPAMADPSAWNTHPTDFSFVTIPDGQVSRTAFRGTGSTFINLRGVPVDASKTYMIEGWYRRTGTDNTVYGLVSLRDGSGAEINGDGSYWLYHPSNANVPTSWTYYSRVFGAGTGRPIPANAREMRVGALPNYNGAAGAIEIQGLRIVEVTRIGGSLYRADGSLANESDIVTSLGTSASTNDAPWSVVSGAGRPSDNAGTIGHLRTMGQHTGIIGNKVFKVTGGTHGAFQGGAVGTAQNGSAYISGSILSAGLPHGWSTYFALDDDDTTFVDSGQNYYLGVFANGVGTGTLGLYADGVYSSVAGVPLNTNSRATIAYDGQKVMGIVDGVVYLSAPARPGQRLFPKILDFYNSVDSAFPHGVIDVRYGAWTENTVSTVTLVPYNAEASVTGSTGTKVGGTNGAWGGGISSREKYAGAAYCSFRIGVSAQPYQMMGLASSSFDGVYNTISYMFFVEGLPASSPLRCYVANVGPVFELAPGSWALTDVLSIVYDGTRVQWLRNGTVLYTYAAAAGQVLGFAASLVYIGNNVTDIQVGPANMVARIGQNTYDDVGGALVGRSNLLTSIGTAAFIAGQTAAATAPDFLVFNNRTDGGSVSVRSPAGGGYSPGAPVTGCLKIRLPQNWSYTMLRFEVDIYDYNVGESVTYLIGGYSYYYGPNPNDGQWINHSAQFIGPRNRAMRVRFGHDGSYPCVYIGETTTVWSYPAVRVKDVNLGYLNIADSLWASGWLVEVTTSVGAITQEIAVPRAGDQVFGEGLLEAPPGSGLPGAGVVATRAAHRTDQGVAAFVVGQGALATRDTVGATQLEADAVGTNKVLAGSITPVYAALTTGTVNWSASAAEKDLQTVASVVVTRGKVIIRASFTCDLSPQGSAAVVGILRLYRNGSEIFLAQTTQHPVATLAAATSFVFSRQWILDFIDDPGPGTYTYKITFDPGHTADGDLRRRFLSVTPMQG